MTDNAPQDRPLLKSKMRALAEAEAQVGPEAPSIATDVTIVAISVHAAPAFELPVLQGFVADPSKHRLTFVPKRGVSHAGQGIAMNGHNIGKFIPHVVVHPVLAVAATISAIATVMSARTCIYGAGRIRLEARGTMGACGNQSTFFPTNMIACGSPVGLPTTVVPALETRSVRFSMELWDHALGAGTWVVDTATSRLVGRIFKAGKDRLKAAGWEIWKRLPEGAQGPAEKVFDAVVKPVISWPVKSLISLVRDRFGARGRDRFGEDRAERHLQPYKWSFEHREQLERARPPERPAPRDPAAWGETL